MKMPDLKVWKHASAFDGRSHCEALSRRGQMSTRFEVSSLALLPLTGVTDYFLLYWRGASEITLDSQFCSYLYNFLGFSEQQGRILSAMFFNLDVQY